MARVMLPPSPLPPIRDQLHMLRARPSRPGADDSLDDAQLAVAFFCSRSATAGIFTPAEAARAAAAYGRDKAYWRRAVLAEAQNLCRAGLPLYALRAGPLGGGLDWSALPAGPHGDRLYRLRAHRFGFLPRLALASYLGAPVLPAMQATLAGWIRWVETGNGAEDAYFSNLVIIYRLLALSWAAPFLAAMADEGDETAAHVCLLLFRILVADARHLAPSIGNSVPNNHLLADRFAAWFLAVCYPELLPSAGAPEALECAWQAELRRQFHADGTNFEQSVHYHELGCEMALVYLVISLRCGGPPAGQVLRLIAAMFRFQAALADCEGRGFALGDTTEDPLLPLDAGSGYAGGAWRILYRALFDPAFPPTADTSAGAERAYWLLAALRGVGSPQSPVGPKSLGQLAAFPDGGYFSFRDEARDDYLLFRSGPRAGTTVSPGHAMSDLLSVYWNTGGKAVLEPAGTYSYAGDSGPAEAGPAAPRSYFRSPAAHNGLVLRGHDPLGVPRGRFRNYDNGARAAARWLALEDVLAWAEAGLEEPGPLRGWRRGVLRVPGHYVIVYDRLPLLPDDADLACHWQFSAEAAVSRRSQRQVLARFGGFSTFLCASRGIATMELAEGRRTPAAGWVSRRYGQLEPAPQLICRVQPGASALSFVLGVSDDQSLPEAEIETGDGEGVIVALRQAGHSAVCVFGRYVGRLQDGVMDIDFDGDVLWLAFAEGRCCEMRALGMRRISSESLGLDLTAAEGGGSGAGWRRLIAEAGPGALSGRWVRTGPGRAVPDWQQGRRR